MQPDISADMFKSLGQEGIAEILLIIAVSWTIIVATQWLVPRLADKLSGNPRYFVLSLSPIVRLVVIVTALIMILLRLIDPTFEKIIALFGAAAVALGFAFKDYVSSLIGGIVALYERPFRPGDWVEVDGAYGQVRSINMRNVEIVTPDDTVVYIPHLKLWDELVRNANNGTPDLMTVADFYLQPGHDAAAVRNHLYDVILTSIYTKLSKPVTVIVQNKPWGVHYRVKGYPVNHNDQFLYITDLTVRGQNALERMGVQPVSVAAAFDESGGIKQAS